MNKLELTKLVSTWLFYIYICLTPILIINITIEQVIIVYFMYWFFLDFILCMFLHRWAAHNLWSPPRWLQKILSIIGTAALIGTPVAWAAWHRTHHAYVDTEKDPHSPKYKSNFYIVFRHQYHSFKIKKALDRLKDDYFMWMSNNELAIILSINLFLFLVLPFQWFMAIWAVPAALATLMTNYGVNVIQHKNGKAENMPWLWPILFSESWHGSHHSNPELSSSVYEISPYIVRFFGWTK